MSNSTSLIIQLRAYVRDRGEPQLSSFINIDVIVERVQGALAFSSLNYTNTINEDSPLNFRAVDTRAFPGTVRVLLMTTILYWGYLLS